MQFKRLVFGVLLLLGIGSVAHTANFPTSISSDANLYSVVNLCYSSLSSAVTASSATLPVAATTNFPTVGFVIVENEVIKYTGKTSNSLTGCTRGADGTSSASHVAGKNVYLSIVAAHHNVLKDEIIALEDYFLNGTLVHISTANSRVGIQNASPAYTLDVGGSINASSTIGGASAVFTGEVGGATMNTGNGSNELYPMDQDVQTTASPFFAGTSLTYGIQAATGVYTTSILTASATVTGALDVGSFSMPTGAVATYVLTADASGNGSWEPRITAPENVASISTVTITTDQDTTGDGYISLMVGTTEQMAVKVAGVDVAGYLSTDGYLGAFGDAAFIGTSGPFWSEYTSTGPDDLVYRSPTEQQGLYFPATGGIMTFGVGIVADEKEIIRAVGYPANRVGISTGTPQATLDVNGDAIISSTVTAGAFIMAAGASSGYVMTGDSVGAGTWQAIPLPSAVSSTGDVTLTSDSDSNDAGDVVINAGAHEMARFSAGNDPGVGSGSLTLNTNHLYVTNTENATTFDVVSSTDGSGVIASALYGDDPNYGAAGSVGLYFGDQSMIYMDYLYGDGEDATVEAAMLTNNASYRLIGSTAAISASALFINPNYDTTFGVVISSYPATNEEMFTTIPRGKLDVRGNAFIDTTLNVATTTVSGSTLTVNGRIESLLGGYKYPNGTTQTIAAALKHQITIIIDGAGSAITTGAKKAYVRVPCNMTLTGWDVVADQAGSIVVDLWKDTYANFPPTVTDTFAGTEKPTLATTQKAQDVSLTSMNTTLTEGEYIEANVDSAATVTKMIITLYGVER
jgi:hypothetical protein